MFFLYFEGFVFKIGTSLIFYYIFIIILLLLLYILIDLKGFFKKIKFLYTKTPFKYLIYFMVFLFVDSIILVITGEASLLIFYYLIMKLFFPAVICYFVSALFVPTIISIRTSLKFLLLSMLFFIIFGFIGYIGDNYNVSLCKGIVDFFSNLKSLMQGNEIMLDAVSGKARMRSVFHEPGSLGKYILILSPILYKVCLSKHTVYTNKYLNAFFKSTLIPLSVFSIILTKSPIILIFYILFLVFYFYKEIITFLKNYFILLFFGIVFFIQLSQNIDIDLTNSYLYRIINTISSINNFDRLVMVEQSLASRVVSYVNAFMLFLHKPFIGYGYDNARFAMLGQFLNSPLQLTAENQFHVNLAFTTNQGCAYNKSLLFGLLVETGLIGTFLYYLFLYKHIKYIDKLMPYFYGIERKFLEGLKISIIIVIIFSFYIYSFATAYCYFYYGFVCSFITQYYANMIKVKYQ